MDQFQSYIYTEKLLSELYRKAAALAYRQDEKNTLLSFSLDATQNMNYLNYFYKMEYGTNYDPMIPDTVINGGYRTLLFEILQQEMTSFLQFRKMTYNQPNHDLNETLRAISDVKLSHAISIMAILVSLNVSEQNVQ